MPIGNNLKAIREKKGIKQQQLAKMSGITSGYISKIEKNTVNPSADKVKKLVIALDTSADKLLFDEEEKEPNEEFRKLFRQASTLKESKKHIIKEILRAYIVQSIADDIKNPQT